MIYNSHLEKIGNEYGIIIPEEIVSEYNLKEGQTVTLDIQDKTVVMRVQLF